MNQKGPVQFNLGKSPDRSNNASSSNPTTPLNPGISPSLSKTCFNKLLNNSTATPSQLPQLPQQQQSQLSETTALQPNTITQTQTIEEENIKSLKQLKISSITTSGSLQLTYKKKFSSNNSPAQPQKDKMHESASNNQLKEEANTTSSSKMRKSSGSSGGARSRSHSRSKYSAYIVSAASAIRSAMIRTSPCSSCKTVSISTQTSLENKKGTYLTKNEI